LAGVSRFFSWLDRGVELGFASPLPIAPLILEKGNSKMASLYFMTNRTVGTTTCHTKAHAVEIYPTATRVGFLIDEPNQSAATKNEINPIPPNKRNKGIDGIDGWRSLRSLSPLYNPCGGVPSGSRGFLPPNRSVDPLEHANCHPFDPVKKGNIFSDCGEIPLD